MSDRARSVETCLAEGLSVAGTALANGVSKEFVFAVGMPHYQFAIGDFCEFLVDHRTSRTMEGNVVEFLPPQKPYIRPRARIRASDGRLYICSTASMAWLPTPEEIKETCKQIQRERGDDWERDLS